MKLAKAMNFNEAGVLVYPIPSSDMLYITDKNKIPLKGLFSVYSVSGNRLIHTNSNPLNIQSLSPGLYYIKIAEASGRSRGTRQILRQ